MLKLADLKREWRELSVYERFEQVVTRIIMLFTSLAIVDSLVLAAIKLINDFQLGMRFTETEQLQDIFGSVLTISDLARVQPLHRAGADEKARRRPDQSGCFDCHSGRCQKNNPARFQVGHV